MDPIEHTNSVSSHMFYSAFCAATHPFVAALVKAFIGVGGGRTQCAAFFSHASEITPRAVDSSFTRSGLQLRSECFEKSKKTGKKRNEVPRPLRARLLCVVLRFCRKAPRGPSKLIERCRTHRGRGRRRGRRAAKKHSVLARTTVLCSSSAGSLCAFPPLTPPRCFGSSGSRFIVTT